MAFAGRAAVTFVLLLGERDGASWAPATRINGEYKNTFACAYVPGAVPPLTRRLGLLSEGACSSSNPKQASRLTPLLHTPAGCLASVSAQCVLSVGLVQTVDAITVSPQHPLLTPGGDACGCTASGVTGKRLLACDSIVLEPATYTVEYSVNGSATSEVGGPYTKGDKTAPLPTISLADAVGDLPPVSGFLGHAVRAHALRQPQGTRVLCAWVKAAAAQFVAAGAAGRSC